MYDTGTRLAAEVSDDVQRFFDEQKKSGGLWSQGRTFETRIRRNIRLAEAPSFGQSIFQYAPNSHGADDYRALANELLDGYETASESGTLATSPGVETTLVHWSAEVPSSPPAATGLISPRRRASA